LAKNGAEQYCAVKIVNEALAHFKNHEQNAAALYQRACGKSVSGLLAITDFAQTAQGFLYYIMPLADGIDQKDPADPDWRPQTLESYVQQRLQRPDWFSIAETRALMRPLFEAVAFLEQTGLCHRDIKPSNILFIGGIATLADIGLLKIADETTAAYGTDYFRKPADINSNPDYWSLAGVLFYILTAKSPQFWNWSNNWKPPQGEFHPDTQKEYQRLRNLVINRATTLHSREQYRSALEFRNDVLGRMSLRKKRKLFFGFAAALVALGIYTAALLKISAPDPYPEIVPLFPAADRAHSIETIIQYHMPYCLSVDTRFNEKLKTKVRQYAEDPKAFQILETCQRKARANKNPPKGNDAPSALLLEFLKLSYDDMKTVICFLAAIRRNDEYFSRQEWAILMNKTFYEKVNRHKMISGASEIFHRLHKDYPELLDPGIRVNASREDDSLEDMQDALFKSDILVQNHP